MSAARVPLIWIGLALVGLGGGNWINGQVKLAEYEAILAHDSRPSQWRSGYPNLSPQINAQLLRPLRSKVSTRSFAEGKRNFYQVVLSGGRVLTLLGLFLTVLGLLTQRRRLRSEGLSVGIGHRVS